jgi:hypothetical protein
VCLLPAKSEATGKRTWLPLARRSGHPRRRPPRCWSGRKRGASRRPRQAGAEAAPFRPKHQRGLAESQQAPPSRTSARPGRRVPRHAARCHCRRSSRPTASSSIDCSFGPGAVMSAARIASLHHASTGRRPVVTASRKIGGRASACGSSRSCLLVGRERLASTCSGELICDRDDRAGRLRRDARLWRGAESRPPRRQCGVPLCAVFDALCDRERNRLAVAPR